MGDSTFSLTALSDMFADFAKRLNTFFQTLKDFFKKISKDGVDVNVDSDYDD